MSDGLRERDQLEVGVDGLVLVGLLGTAASHRTWVAAGPDRRLHVARRVSGRTQAQRARLLELMTRLERIAHPSVLSPSRAWEHEGAVWVVRPHDGGVSMRRLVAVARLSPRQVAALAIDVIEGLAALHAARAVHGGLHPGNILVGIDGRGRIADMGLAALRGRAGAASQASGRAGGPGRDLEAAVAALRAALAEPARRGAAAAARARVPPAPSPLEALLNGSGPGLKALGTAEAALIELRRVAGAPDLRAQREIAALVVPLLPPRPVVPPPVLGAGPPSSLLPPSRPEVAVPAPPPADAGAAPGKSGHRPALAKAVTAWRATALAAIAKLLARPPADAQGRRGRGGRRLAALLILLAAAAVIVTVLVVMGARRPAASPPRARLGPSATAWGPSAPSPPATSEQPRPALLAVGPPPAPPTDGEVTGLTLSLVGSPGCTAAAGQSCVLRVRVDLAPHETQTPVVFGLVVVDRCTGDASTTAGTSVLAASWFGYVWADAPVAFPSGDPVTLYAVTSAPGRAASPGLALPGSRRVC